MKFRFNTKYNTIALYVILVFVICLLSVTFVFKFDTFSSIAKSMIAVISPVLWGLAIAYLLNPVMKFCEKKLMKLSKSDTISKPIRGASVAITIITSLALITTMILIVLPEIANNLENIITLFPDYLASSQKTIEGFVEETPQLQSFMASMDLTVSDLFDQIVIFITNKVVPEISSIVTSVASGAMTVLIGIKDFLIGYIIAIYLLISKEKFKIQAKKVIYSLFKKENAYKILDISRESDYTFGSFLTGKIIDSTIIGIICFICCSLLNFPYAGLISIIIGITNIIPFFGPFIGAIPCAFLILLVEPSKVILFVLFILILQQFDGNILGPKILGDCLGLSAFWIMFAILVGGGLFGFIGMVVGVPFFAVIYNAIRRVTERRLLAKEIPDDDIYLSKPYEDADKYKKTTGKLNRKIFIRRKKKNSADEDSTDKNETPPLD